MTPAELFLIIGLLTAFAVVMIFYVGHAVINVPEKQDRRHQLRRRAELAEDTLRKIEEISLQYDPIDHVVAAEIRHMMNDYRRELHP